MDLVAATQEAQAKNEWLTKRDVVDVLVYCLRTMTSKPTKSWFPCSPVMCLSPLQIPSRWSVISALSHIHR